MGICCFFVAYSYFAQLALNLLSYLIRPVLLTEEIPEDTTNQGINPDRLH